MERLDQRYKYERSNLFTKFVERYFDKDNKKKSLSLTDFTPNGMALRAFAGVLNSAMGGDSRAAMTREREEAHEIFESMNISDPQDQAELLQAISRATRSCNAYRGIKQSLGDTVSYYATTGIVLVGGTAFLVATGGSGGVLLVALGTGAASFGVNAGTKIAFNGAGYGSEGAWKDAGVAAVETASMVGGAHLGRLASQRFGRALVRQELMRRGKDVSKVSVSNITTRLDYYSRTHRVQKGIIDGAVDGTFGGAAVEGMWTAVDSKTWEDGTLNGLSKVSRKGWKRSKAGSCYRSCSWWTCFSS